MKTMVLTQKHCLARRGYILASESVLKEICTPEELEILRRSSRILAKEVAEDDATDKDDNDSSDESSSQPPAIQMPRAVGGVISLREVSIENEPTGQLAVEAGTGVGDNVTIVVSDKGKRKVTECAYYISNVGKSTSGKDIDYYVEEAHRVFLDIPTDTADDNLQVSQNVVKEKGKTVAEDETVVRNLNSEFDGSTSERTIMIGRGYPCDGDGDDTKILGMIN
ncbi:hypothetical protein Bca4012_037350 [Brassica carinata]